MRTEEPLGPFFPHVCGLGRLYIVGFLQSNLLIRLLTPELKSSIEVTPTAKINSEQKKVGSPIHKALLVFVLQRLEGVGTCKIECFLPHLQKVGRNSQVRPNDRSPATYG